MTRVLFLVLGVLLFSAPQVRAASPSRRVIAQYAFAVVLPNGNYGLATATLRENRRLRVRLDDRGATGFAPSIAETTITTSRWLSGATFSELRKDVVILANAEINVVSGGLLCLGFGPLQFESNDLFIRRDYSYGNDEFRGDLSLVLGANSCAHFMKTFPSFERNNPVAHELREKLEALSAHALGDNIDRLLY